MTKWRAISTEGNVVEGESYFDIKDILFREDHGLSWTLEFFDSNNEWIEMETYHFVPETDKIYATRGSHKEHVK